MRPMYRFGWVLALAVPSAWAQVPAPQMSFFLEQEAIPRGSGTGELSPACPTSSTSDGCSLIQFTSDGLVVLRDATTSIDYFQTDGTFQRSVTGTGIEAFAIAPDDWLYVFEAPDTIAIYDNLGGAQGGWTNSELDTRGFLGQFAVDGDGKLYFPTDDGVLVIGPTGMTEALWGTMTTSSNPLPGELRDIKGVHLLDDGHLAVHQFRDVDRYTKVGVFQDRMVALGDTHKHFSISDDDVYLLTNGANNGFRVFIPGAEQDFPCAAAACSTAVWTGDTTNIRGGAFLGDRMFLVYRSDPGEDTLRVYRRSYRTLGANLPNALPMPRVISTTSVSNTGFADIVFDVRDPDDATVDVALVAFEDGIQAYANLIPMTSLLINGNTREMENPVATNTTHLASWDVATDFGQSQPFVDVRVMVLARKFGFLMDLHFVTFPANYPDGCSNCAASLEISRGRISEDDMRFAWYWLLADGDPDVALVGGQVVDSATMVTVYANDSGTTAAGRQFLFDRLGVREATNDEIDRAVGAGYQFTPRNRVGDRPSFINEYSIDTSAGGWLVVPLM